MVLIQTSPVLGQASQGSQERLPRLIQEGLPARDNHTPLLLCWISIPAWHQGRGAGEKGCHSCFPKALKSHQEHWMPASSGNIPPWVVFMGRVSHGSCWEQRELQNPTQILEPWICSERQQCFRAWLIPHRLEPGRDVTLNTSLFTAHNLFNGHYLSILSKPPGPWLSQGLMPLPLLAVPQWDGTHP